jgi:hypothetical protein
VSRILDALARHHARTAAACGAAALAAQSSGDLKAAAGFLADMHAAQARRDALARGEIVIPFRIVVGYAVAVLVASFYFLTT